MKIISVLVLSDSFVVGILIVLYTYILSVNTAFVSVLIALSFNLIKQFVNDEFS